MIGTVNKRQITKGNSAESLHFRGAVARNLRRVAASREVTMEQLASRIGMTRERIYTVLQATCNLSAIELTLIARELDVTTDELVKDGVL